MTFDPSKLTPEPWEVDGTGWVLAGDDPIVECFDHKGLSLLRVAEFIALARNAFDVMMRRGWSAERNAGGTAWAVKNAQSCNYVGHIPGKYVPQWPDPFTALVAADEWYKANVEKKP